MEWKRNGITDMNECNYKHKSLIEINKTNMKGGSIMIIDLFQCALNKRLMID